MRVVIGSLVVLLLAACQGKQVGVEGVPFCGADEKLWGMVEGDGTVICSNVFEEKPSPVVNRRFAVPDTSGKWRLFGIGEEVGPVSEEKYVALGHFFEDVAVAQREKGAPLEVIDRQGRRVAVLDSYLGSQLLVAHNFREGRALIYTSSGKYGYVDTEGRVVIPPEYDYACDFSEGLALVGEADKEGRLAFRVIDREGNPRFAVTLQDCRLNEFFSDGYLLFRNSRQGYSGALNERGEVAVCFPQTVKLVAPYRSGVALFWTDKGVGLMDKKGGVLVPAVYEDGKMIGNDRVALQSDGKWGVFTLQGKPLSGFKYDGIAGGDGCVVGVRDSVCVLLDGNGRELEEKEYAALAWDFLVDRHNPEVFAVREMEEKPLPDTVAPQEVKKKAKPRPRLLQARIDEDNPFYQEAKRVWNGGLEEKDAESRRVILNYMEHFRMSYVTKDIDFLEQLFSERALIIVGNVVREASDDGRHYLSTEKVNYNVRTKREYLDRLREIFNRNKAINVEFTDFSIRRHPTREGIYGVSVKQRYTSDIYSDEGYLFLLWDFRDETAPKIHVRTWQPRMLDEHTPLPEQEIFNIGSFNLE